MVGSTGVWGGRVHCGLGWSGPLGFGVVESTGVWGGRVLWGLGWSGPLGFGSGPLGFGWVGFGVVGQHVRLLFSGQ